MPVLRRSNQQVATKTIQEVTSPLEPDQREGFMKALVPATIASLASR
jgi:hypothetical protein